MVSAMDLQGPVRLSEDAIERTAEARMDRLDRRYMRGLMTAEEYERAVAELDAWVKTAA